MKMKKILILYAVLFLFIIFYATAFVPFIPSISNNYASLPAGTTTIDYSRNEYAQYLSIVHFELTTDAQSNDVRFILKQMDAVATALEKEFSGTVYLYFSISHVNLLNEDINNARMRFKVSKSWFAENTFDKNKISLMRYDISWKTLSTKIINEDDSFVYYQAYSPGLDLFAVVSSEKNAEIIYENEETGSEQQTGVANENSSEKNPLVKVLLIVGIAVVLLIILGGVLFFIAKQKKKKSHPQHHEKTHEKKHHEKKDD